MSEALKLEQEEQDFIVDDDQKAEWCLKKRAEAIKDKEFWKQHYENCLRAIEAEADATIERMEYMLRKYFDTVPHKKTQTQENYKLPSGKLVMKKQQPEFKRDENAVIDFLKKNGETQYIKVKETLDWDQLKRDTIVVGENIVDEDGMIIEGIRVVSRPDTFKVEG